MFSIARRIKSMRRCDGLTMVAYLSLDCRTIGSIWKCCRTIGSIFKLVNLQICVYSAIPRQNFPQIKHQLFAPCLCTVHRVRFYFVLTCCIVLFILSLTNVELTSFPPSRILTKFNEVHEWAIN